MTRGSGDACYRPDLGLVLSAASVAGRADVIEEVTVTATLREQSLIEAPVSITVLDEQRLRDAGRQHFEDVLAAAPNLHWAAGTSRPRYFQIRGIGEREQYEGAPNPSVGFLIDDIDFSGAAMPATLFDVERIEVLRGPQGMRYGANALAGLIVMRGHDPAGDAGFATEASLGDYDSRSIGVMATAPVESLDSAWRVAVQQHVSDGFRENAFLGRDDTNNRDELTARAKWRWLAGDATTLDLTWLYADMDNGYDAWSIDNTRRSLADDPGKDAQRANGASLRLTTSLGSVGRLTVIAAGSNIESEYSFDGDWGNAQSWAPYTYDYFYRAMSSRRTRSFEARLASEAVAAPDQIAWLFGVYTLNLDESIDETSVGEYIDPDFPEFSGATDDRLHSDYDARNVAVFGQLDGLFSARWGWSFGLRTEQRDADYQDRGVKDAELRATDADERDRMWGGQATVHFDPREQARFSPRCRAATKRAASILGAPQSCKRALTPEYLWSLDVGAKAQWLDGALYADVVAFYMKRSDMQIATGVQLDPIGDPNSYLFITDNASGGSNLGVEASLRWRAVDHIELGVALGLLETSYSGYRSAGVGLDDREQTHAPEYQASFNATWRHPLGGWRAST